MLIIITTIIIVDIDNEKFPQNFIKTLKDELEAQDLNTNEFTLSQYKYKKIISILCKKINMSSDDIKIIENRNLVLLDLSKDTSIHEFMKNSNTQTKFDINNEFEIYKISDRFNSLYGNYLKFNLFDERLFLIEKNNTDCSPVKVTPFRQQNLFSRNNLVQSITEKQPTAFKNLNFGVPNKINNTILPPVKYLP
jgi:hypothetical protein